MNNVQHCQGYRKATMSFGKIIFLFFCLIALEAYALNCRTDGGPRESELKNIYQKCLKMQSKNTTNRNNDQDWEDSRGNYQKDRDRDRKGDDNRRNNGNDWVGSNSRAGTSDSWLSNSNSKINNNERNRNDGTSGRNEGIVRYDGGNRYDGAASRYDGTNNEERNGRNGYYGNHDDRGRNDHLTGRNDFQTGEFDDMYQYNGYRTSSQSPRRYKRERRVENTGQRSQYNPNTQRNSGYEDSYRSDEKNSSENNTNADNKACALQCFLENLQMTAQDGMPDKYLVTHAITKDVKNDDLRDFLQESVDECFQILENEDSDDKCEFSKNLLLCLSEKGKANCDDWKDDMHF